MPPSRNASELQRFECTNELPDVLLFLLVLLTRRLLALDGQQFHLKNESRTRADVCACTPISIGEISGDEQLPLRSNGHELKSFRPPLDDSVYGECYRLTGLVRAVKFLAVDESSPVIADNAVGSCGLRASALFQDLVLQATGQGNDTLFPFVGGQKCIAFFLVSLGGLLHLFLLLLLHIFLHLHERSSSLI